MNRLRYTVMSPSGDKKILLGSSTERVLCQELNVVTSQTNSEVNLKKIAKKRRGACGTVDVEYTKSSKEYLQKVQKGQPIQKQEAGNIPSVPASDSSFNSNSAQKSSESSSNPYGYQDPDAAPRKFKGPVHRSFSQPSISSSGNPYGYGDGDPAASNPYGYGDAPPSNNTYGYEDPAASNPYGYGDAAPSNPYGYEDPDSAPRIRRRGAARRRGSVTKFSIDAAAVTAVTDRILQKTSLFSQNGGGERRNMPMRRSTCAHVSSSNSRWSMMSMGNGKSKVSPPVIFDVPANSDIRPTTPKRQASFGNLDGNGLEMRKESMAIVGNPKENFANTNEQPKSSFATSPMAVDCYENSTFAVASPQRPKPRRRRPEIKDSAQIRNKVVGPEPMEEESSQGGFQPLLHHSFGGHNEQLSSLGPEMETSLNDVQGSESRWSPTVPDQSLGHRAPQRSTSNQSFKKHFMSPKRSGSLRSLSRAAANLRKDKGDSSFHDSVCSGASCDDGSIQGPQASNYQSPKWRRKFVRSNSIGSIGSDCESLASDMESLCSISVRTDEKPGLPSPATSFRKCVVSRTPSKISRHNSNGSLFGSRTKDGSNDDGSVAALKALNLENASKQSFGVSRSANPNSVGRSYSGDALRLLRDQKVVREQH